MSRIIDAISCERLEDARRLIVEYQTFLNVDLCFQNFDAEIDNLSGFYARPGQLYLGLDQNDHAVGCIGFHPLGPAGDKVAELKRLYVQPSSQSNGLGRQLLDAALDAAREAGFRSIRLDTLPTLTTAILMYRKIGFVDIEAYYDNPISGVLYMSKDL